MLIKAEDLYYRGIYQCDFCLRWSAGSPGSICTQCPLIEGVHGTLDEWALYDEPVDSAETPLTGA